MNSNALFVKWVKDRHPQVFAVALRRAKTRSALGGLGDDLTGDITVDTGSISVDPSVSAAVDQAAADQTTSSDWSGLIDSIANAVSTVAPQIVQTKAQLAQIQVNQTRAQHGLAPLGMTTTGFASSSGVMLAGLGLLAGAFLLLGKTRSSTNRRA